MWPRPFVFCANSVKAAYEKLKINYFTKVKNVPNILKFLETFYVKRETQWQEKFLRVEKCVKANIQQVGKQAEGKARHCNRNFNN